MNEDIFIFAYMQNAFLTNLYGISQYIIYENTTAVY